MESAPKTYLAQLTLKSGKYGKYFTGKLGMTFVTLAQSKNSTEKWNLYVQQAPRQNNYKPSPNAIPENQFNNNDSFGSEDIPF